MSACRILAEDHVGVIRWDGFNEGDVDADLVEPLARLDPRLEKMAPGGERPED
jgi:hypothetical protein